MDEKANIIERLKVLADVRSDRSELFPRKYRASADYLGLRGSGWGQNRDGAEKEALEHLTEKLLQVRDHVALMLAPDIDPTKRQVLPTVKL